MKGFRHSRHFSADTLQPSTLRPGDPFRIVLASAADGELQVIHRDVSRRLAPAFAARLPRPNRPLITLPQAGQFLAERGMRFQVVLTPNAGGPVAGGPVAIDISPPIE